jgi:hypothetical protein
MRFLHRSPHKPETRMADATDLLTQPYGPKRLTLENRVMSLL